MLVTVFFNQLLIFHKTNCITGKCNTIQNTECKWVLLLGKCLSISCNHSPALVWYFPEGPGYSSFHVGMLLAEANLKLCVGYIVFQGSLSVQSSNSFYLVIFLHGFC